MGLIPIPTYILTIILVIVLIGIAAFVVVGGVITMQENRRQHGSLREEALDKELSKLKKEVKQAKTQTSNDIKL